MIGTKGKGIFTFNLITKKITPIKTFPENIKVNDLLEDPMGRLWAATENNGIS